MRRIFRSDEWAAKLPSAGIALKWADILFVGVNSTHNLHASLIYPSQLVSLSMCRSDGEPEHVASKSIS